MSKSEHTPLWETVINEYGGYEKCKEILKNQNIDFIMNAHALRKHMLEYRRQNNIFEVEDWVVLPYDDDIESLQKITHINDKHGIVSYSNGCCGYGDKIRHAEPEEIQAGHRL